MKYKFSCRSYYIGSNHFSLQITASIGVMVALKSCKSCMWISLVLTYREQVEKWTPNILCSSKFMVLKHGSHIRIQHLYIMVYWMRYPSNWTRRKISSNLLSLSHFFLSVLSNSGQEAAFFPLTTPLPFPKPNLIEFSLVWFYFIFDFIQSVAKPMISLFVCLKAKAVSIHWASF